MGFRRSVTQAPYVLIAPPRPLIEELEENFLDETSEHIAYLESPLLATLEQI